MSERADTRTFTEIRVFQYENQYFQKYPHQNAFAQDMDRFAFRVWVPPLLFVSIVDIHFIAYDVRDLIVLNQVKFMLYIINLVSFTIQKPKQNLLLFWCV